MFGITELYSKKNRPQPDVIQYGTFPRGLRIQLLYIVKDFFSRVTDYNGNSQSENLWLSINEVLRREHELLRLYDALPSDTWEFIVCSYFMKLDQVDKQLDFVQLAGRYIEYCMDGDYECEEYTPQTALGNINTRLQEHGMGYRYQAGEIIKVPSEFTYELAIQPALVLLHQTGFENAQQEFLSAFEHYKKGPTEYEEALTNCLKAVESTIKIIATARGWAFNQNDTAKPLIALVIKEGLVPSYSESFLAGMRNTLESGIPTLRNKLGGHGKGAEARTVDEASMHYGINLTASVILYLVQRHQEMPLAE